MKSLGLADEDLIFLGYPDFGTMQIFTKYWDSVRPFKSMLTRVSAVPYPNCMSPQAPYTGESVLKDLKTILLDFKPTKIFVSHPVDSNGDHRALYLFLRVALWDIDGKMSDVEIFPYLIHNSGWPMPRGYHPELELVPPRNLSGSEIVWQPFTLTKDEVETKKKTINFYTSEIKYSPKYLFTFARENELFGDYPIIALQKQQSTEHHWFDILKNSQPAVQEGKKDGIKALSYEQKDNVLFIKFLLGKKIDKDFWSSIFIFGYKRSKDFAEMPKLKIDVTVDGLRVRDKTKLLVSEDIKMVYDKESIVVSVPAFTMGNPDYVLSCARVNTKDVPYSDTAWRVIELE
jgi:LmbE family N-acetylglucosaminyl deacetylase